MRKKMRSSASLPRPPWQRCRRRSLRISSVMPRLASLLAVFFVVSYALHWKATSSSRDAQNLPRAPGKFIKSWQSDISMNDSVGKISLLRTHSKSPPEVLGLLYPSGLLGGYRNQVIRFTELVRNALQRNITRLFLPSLLWSTQVATSLVNTSKTDTRTLKTYPIPMQWVFDVDYWNEVASESHLPYLVTRTESSMDCWQRLEQNSSISSRSKMDPTYTEISNFLSQSSEGRSASAVWPIEALLREQGYIPGLLNVTVSMMTDTLVNARRRDYLAYVDPTLGDPTKESLDDGGCQNPVFFGGGTHGGRLWKEAMAAVRNHEENRNSENPLEEGEHDTLKFQVMKALQPASVWRNAADKCLMSRGLDLDNYVAIHTRVELDMLGHTCGQNMEGSLDKIFEQVQDFQLLSDSRPSGILLLVSRNGIIEGGARNSKLELAMQNLYTLTSYVNESGYSAFKRLMLAGSDLPVVECGRFALEQYMQEHNVEQNYGTLVESVINFHAAIHASTFIGVVGSSYSNHIWTTRYLLGKGKQNFMYSKGRGILPVANSGLPSAHEVCHKTGKK